MTLEWLVALTLVFALAAILLIGFAGCTLDDTPLVGPSQLRIVVSFDPTLGAANGSFRCCSTSCRMPIENALRLHYDPRRNSRSPSMDSCHSNSVSTCCPAAMASRSGLRVRRRRAAERRRADPRAGRVSRDNAERWRHHLRGRVGSGRVRRDRVQLRRGGQCVFDWLIVAAPFWRFSVCCWHLRGYRHRRWPTATTRRSPRIPPCGRVRSTSGPRPLQLGDGRRRPTFRDRVGPDAATARDWRHRIRRLSARDRGARASGADLLVQRVHRR